MQIRSSSTAPTAKHERRSMVECYPILVTIRNDSRAIQPNVGA